MPSFAYKAMTSAGQDVAGTLDAADRAGALRDLVARGIHVTEIAERSAGLAAWLGRSEGGTRLHIRPRQLAVLTRQLATSLEAGLPLMTALEVMRQELEQVTVRRLLEDLARRVQQGANLSDAMAEYPRVFSPMYVRLVRVGETGGILDVVMGQLADMLERGIELRERLKTASIYPSIVLLLGLVSVAIIVMFIVPRIVASIGVETFLLPWPTRVLMTMSSFVGVYGWLLLIVLVAAVLGWRQAVLRGPGRLWWDRLTLKMPIVGRLVRQLEACRFARGLGLLTRGGIGITEALPVVSDVIQNSVIRQALHDLGISIQSGESIAGPLQRTGFFPPLLAQMVRVGENTGRLDEMLLRSAAVHEAQTQVTLGRLVSVLPVAMVLVLACVIGFIVAALVLAIVEFQTTGMNTFTR